MTHPLTHDDPSRLGRYRLLARLGSGGMGTVYLGRSPGGRTVALKTMHADFAVQAEFRNRFRLEIDAARIIGGDHGALVVDADPLAETPWLATEYVLGPPLDDAVELYGPLTESATRGLGALLCDALAQLHHSDVVHRDLKPSNILITAHGPKVIDFGIARAAGDDRLTRTGMAAGTPAFMSPEQATAREHTAAGDVFALAGVLVFAATGHGPFGVGQPADLLYRVRYGEPDLTGVPEALRHVLERCFSKGPETRPSTVQLRTLLGDGPVEFADTLSDLVLADILRRSESVWAVQPSRTPAPECDARTQSALRAGRRELPRRRALALGGAGALVLGGGAAATWAWTRPDGDEDQAEPSPSSTSRPEGAAPKAEWKADIPTAVDFAVLVGDYLALGSESGLTTMAVRTGERSKTNDAAFLQSFPAADGDQFYGIDPDALTVRRINPRTGKFQESIVALSDLGMRSPQLRAAHRGTLYLGEYGKTNKRGKSRYLFGVDAESGREVWRSVASDPEDEEFTVVARTDEALVLATSHVNPIWAISARTGETLWSRKFPVGRNRITISQGDGEPNIYLGLDKITALRIADGKIIWRFGEDRKAASREQYEDINYCAPISDGEVVYAVERGYGLVAVDAASGRLLWDLKADWATDAPYLDAPAIGTKYVYVPTDGARWVTAVDRQKRKEAWTFLGADGLSAATLLPARSAKKLVVVNDRTVLSLPLE